VGKFVFERYSRLVSAGDSTNPDRIQEGTYTDDTTWGASDYGDVGYKDGTDIVGITEAFEGLYIVFKRGDSGLKTYYASSLSSTNPQARLVSDNHSAFVHAGVSVAEGTVYVIESNIISALRGLDAQGKVIYDNTVGLKLGEAFTATSTAWAVTYPRDAQIWFTADPISRIAYIYHYRINAWSEFNFGARQIYSGYYNPTDDFLYIGCDDGFTYKYDRTSFAYADTAGAYDQRLKTKVFTQPQRDVNIKAPMLVWQNLASGSGSFYVKEDYGKSTVLNDTFTTSNPSLFIYDTQDGQSDATDIFDTQEGGTSELYLFPQSYSDTRFQKNMVVNNFQFDIQVSSGGMSIERIVSGMAGGRKFN